MRSTALLLERLTVKKVNVVLVDDLDGRIIEDGGGRAVAFAFDGQSYELDLATENLDRLRDALRPFTEAARKAGGGGRGGRATKSSASPRPRASAAKADVQAIRAWANANGHQVGDRGRIAGPIREAYERAQKG